MFTLGSSEQRADLANQKHGGAAAYSLAMLVAAAIIYGSLYPFDFHDAGTFGADISHLAGTWNQLSQSRGDTLANLLLYMPLGLTIALALTPSRSKFAALLVAGLCGAVLSLTIELTQFFDASRVSVLSDFYLNTVGTFAGALLARATGAGWIKASWPSGSAPAFARLLLLAWLGWRLYPYVPTIDLHKYWHSVRPLLTPQIAAYDVLRYAVYWWSAIFLFQIGLGAQRMKFILLAALCVFAAKILIIGLIISPAELLGAGLAIILGQPLLKRHAAIAIPCLATLLLLTVILSRVMPWQIGTAQKAFQWMPFYSVLHGSLTVNAISFAEKFCLYGAALLALVSAGMGLALAVGLECLILFATSLLQTFMIDRSAEITDVVLALLTGVIYAFLRRQFRGTETV